jgi:transcriptional regulator with XRE-family HTH domain
MAIEANRFGARLRELRTSAGLSQPELARMAGMSKDGLARIEQGRRSPSWDTVLALAAALGVSCEVFREEPGEGSEEKRGRGRPKA